ncbi:hypothetical protein Cgig2_004279 [Carnegiea gigantea]|uniref:MORF/ORRM1/DAG-like MORF domain-containing protein n=1 Tax=Carnegiea gigantea TaxID=171969 RepID=A0A9Q1KGH0_9CARY|nr:hypothetical protein Cgig2_004279 [Carnegiea gigantea]
MATLAFSVLPRTLPPSSSQPLKPSIPQRPTICLSYQRSSPLILQSFRWNRNTPSRGFSVRAAVDGGTSANRSSKNGEQREAIMLPGCDYKHWLIVMDFPKDPAPSREQMIDTYLNTLATVLGSMEEAKKNMYAFSTTTYTGFQCTVDEETSEKFKGLPGVLWVLPDSYIDVKNKDYGGAGFFWSFVQIYLCVHVVTYGLTFQNVSASHSKMFLQQEISISMARLFLASTPPINLRNATLPSMRAEDMRDGGMVPQEQQEGQDKRRHLLSRPLLEVRSLN